MSFTLNGAEIYLGYLIRDCKWVALLKREEDDSFREITKYRAKLAKDTFVKFYDTNSEGRTSSIGITNNKKICFMPDQVDIDDVDIALKEERLYLATAKKKNGNRLLFMGRTDMVKHPGDLVLGVVCVLGRNGFGFTWEIGEYAQAYDLAMKG